ncbi:MAG: S41 family peptidase [Acetobacteraceae bacterium]|nr:S41 family peptidase [Acetobacteraceae bacterium]
MIRVSALLFILLIGRANADAGVGGSGGIGFDPHLTTEVYATALAFMAPRTLEPVPVSQLTLWGLRGLTALDPAVIAELRDGRLRLVQQNRPVFDTAGPKDEDPRAWATVATSLASAAVGSSPAIRQAGTQGIVQSFFDEVFNHLDPYSRYVGPSEAGEDREQRNGVAGIGLTLMKRGAAIVVQSVIGEGPAALAGLRPGDAILTVDGQGTRGRDVAAVAGWIAGPENTVLTLAWRGRDGRVRSQDMTRVMVPPDTVFTQRVGDTLILRITGFNHSTDAQLSRALQDELASPRAPTGLVLDLRGNRGGLLRQAVTAADALLPTGVIAYTAGRDPAAAHVWRSGSGELAEDVPIVVTVDGRTASAAEVLAAALADRGRAVVVGSVTLGKGLVQTIAGLPDGGELFVTWSRVLAPRLWPLQGLGVLPQVCTSLGGDVLHRQLAALADGIQPMQAAILAHRAARAPLPPAQVLALRAPCPAAEGRDADIDTARTLIGNPAAYAAALLPPMIEGQQSAVVPPSQ